MSLHVVLGKGPVGSTLTDRLVEAGVDVRVASRTGGRSSGRVEHVALDASDAGALTAAARGADVLYNCANPPYHRWVEQWPPVADALLAAAESTGAVLVVMGNLYVYGPVDRPMTEDLPLSAPGTKGRVRVAMWEQALARHRAGALRMTEARASDFVGPRVVATGYLGERAVPRVLAGRAVQHIATPDQPHSWTSVDDVARTLEVLGADERAWGRAWHVPTAPRSPTARPCTACAARRASRRCGSRSCRTRCCVPRGCSPRCCASSRRRATSSPGRTSWTAAPRRRPSH